MKEKTHGEPSHVPGISRCRDWRSRCHRRVSHPSLGKVKGANERINIGILGPGAKPKSISGSSTTSRTRTRAQL